ncbi:MAG: hypothetical protein J0L99_03085 [Chitinophagales bacterium]|nr:hypothetical protein [Chitinophagales bacterium]
MKQFALLFCALLMAFGCNSDASAGQSAATTATTIPAEGFAFSTGTPTVDMRDPESWCNQSFPESLIFYPDAQNPDLRFLQIPAGITKLIVKSGYSTASMMLQYDPAKAPGTLTIYSSDQLPYCTSNRMNFSISEDRKVLQYSNKKEITFALKIAEQQGNSLKVYTEVAEKTLYGWEARRME